MTTEQQQERKPWISVVITIVLIALTIQDQLSSGSIDFWLLATDLVLIAFWMGQPIDALLKRFLR